MNHYSWLQDYLARLDGKEARREYYERYHASWHETARKLAEAILESQRMLTNYSFEVQEHHAQLTRSFFASVDQIIRTQSEGNLVVSRRLAEQAVKGQEAAQTLARESANAYIDFLDSMFSYYRENTKTIEGSGDGQPRL